MFVVAFRIQFRMSTCISEIVHVGTVINTSVICHARAVECIHNVLLISFNWLNMKIEAAWLVDKVVDALSRLFTMVFHSYPREQ